MENLPSSSQLIIDEPLRRWLPEASVRFQYLYPEIELTIDGDIVRFAGKNAGDPRVKREFQFCLYRQKIFEQTLPMRKMLIEGVTGNAGRTS
ncbi:hypothetical protein [uncultured Agrobacterium sp.]|uniref:hypothetical protein n=1 Tax=uncultured Agrobacterium sp. TaxID=157277 RepID=UPI0025E7B50C|nr:hypothetical protein [uncultured Agrobacterium sp.]